MTDVRQLQWYLAAILLSAEKVVLADKVVLASWNWLGAMRLNRQCGPKQQ